MPTARTLRARFKPEALLPFHRNLKGTAYVEQLRFPDIRAFEAFLATMADDTAPRSATARYEAEFGVRNCAFTLLSLDG